jgi:hypothetical protein
MMVGWDTAWDLLDKYDKYYSELKVKYLIIILFLSKAGHYF